VSAEANAEQAEYWGGYEGQHWAAEQDRYDRMLDPFNEVLVGAAVESASDRVIDVGCGNGSTSRALARALPEGHVLGVDLSEPMLERARATAEAEGIANVEFVRADAQSHGFPTGGADAVASRFGIMFFDDPVAAFANLRTALRDGGRLAVMCWRDALENEWIAVPAGALLEHLPMPDLGAPGQPGPFSLADPDHTRAILAEAGFADVGLEPLDRPNRFGTDLDDATAFLRSTSFGKGMFEGADPATVERALDALREASAPYLGPDGLVLGSAAWLVTARRLG